MNARTREAGNYFLSRLANYITRSVYTVRGNSPRAKICEVGNRRFKRDYGSGKWNTVATKHHWKRVKEAFPVMVIRCIRDRDKEEIERISVNSDL